MDKRYPFPHYKQLFNILSFFIEIFTFNILICPLNLLFKIRDVAQPGSALRSGRRGRRFESCHPDLAGQTGIISVCPVFIFAVIPVQTVYYAGDLIDAGSSK